MGAVVIPFPKPADDGSSARLERLIMNGDLDAAADAMCSPEEWAWSAVGYLKEALTGTLNGSAGGSVHVSAAAIGVLLTFVETLATETGRIGGRE